MSDINQLIEKLKTFRDERDWEQFHNPKDLAIALSIEASELLEVFLWKFHQEADKEKIKEETKATIRCIPLNNETEIGNCIYSGKPSIQRVAFARAY